ncbi:MAG: LCP family protein [Veillonellaceae bacterium]|nr:LCP family protein [Veillonellaceae bacterium]
MRKSRIWPKVLLFLFVVASLAGAAMLGRNLALYGHVWGPGESGNRINILLVGIDDGDLADPKNSPHRSDSMLLLGVHKGSGAVSLLSIPRDTRVPIPGHSNNDKFGHSFAYGGVDLTIATLQEFLKVPVHYYVVADWQGFIRVVDALGGVDLYVENKMDYEDPYANLKIHLKKGFQHLNGQQAGQYVRFRYDEMGDIGRVIRQQKFLKALATQAIRPSNLIRLPQIMGIIGQSVQTNMTPWSFRQVFMALPSLKGNKIQSDMVPGNFANIGGVSYWASDPEETRKVVERLFIAPPQPPAEKK